ncbi:MAG: zf-TFIIB domain-containing protein [Myxococcaceae bacterium]
MNCPRCQEPLVRHKHDAGGQELDVQKCASCTGHWFEQKDLKAIEDTVEVVLFAWLKLPGQETQARTLFCPRCDPQKVMDKVINEHDTRVVMDVCGNCHGVWLHHGELEALQRRNVLAAVLDAVRFIKKN